MIFSPRFGAIVLTAVMALPGLASAEEDAERIESRPHHGGEPEQISFSIYLIDVDNISERDQSFTVNMVTRVRWKDERLAHPGPGRQTIALEEIWNPRLLLANRAALLKSVLPEEVRVEPDGTVTYRQQYVGPLSQPLNLVDFPRDTQDFSIHFVSADYTPAEIQFVPDPVLGAEHLLGGGMADTLSLPNWHILEYSAEARPFKVTNAIQAAGFALEFTAKRYTGYYFWQVIMPLILIVMMSWAPFWVDPSKGGLQLGLASSTVMTLIAYRFLLATLVPKLSYMTRMDYLSLGATILVFASFLQVLVTSVLGYGRHRALARKLDLWCRGLYPLVFGALVVWSLVL